MEFSLHETELHQTNCMAWLRNDDDDSLQNEMIFLLIRIVPERCVHLKMRTKRNAGSVRLMYSLCSMFIIETVQRSAALCLQSHINRCEMNDASEME